MSKKPTFNDFQEASPKDLQRVYKLNQAGLENAQRDVCYGANTTELRREYDKFYRRNRRDA